MPVVPLREFGRKPSKSRPKTEKELEAERRLEQALGRLQAALPLGWANSESTFSGSLGRESTSLWFVAEASVQQQASKAILGLAEALAEHFRAVERELSWGKRVQVNPNFSTSLLAVVQQLLAKARQQGSTRTLTTHNVSLTCKTGVMIAASGKCCQKVSRFLMLLLVCLEILVLLSTFLHQTKSRRRDIQAQI